MIHYSLDRLDAVAQAELVARGELTPADLLAACERRIAALNPLLRAAVTVDNAVARERMAGLPKGPLAGVPFLIKDLVAYPRMRCAFGSRLFASYVPPQGSPFTERLDAAGLLTIGKTASSELGLLGSTETVLEGVTHNPWDLSLSAAGSSGGSAAAVAAGLVPLAHANDGGGSIRVPASVCGVFGLKPSRGRTVPTSLVASEFADLVSDGCISRTVRDSARFLSIVENRDSDLPPLGDVRGPSARRLRIAAWTTTLVGAEPEPAVRAAFDEAVALCRSLGHTVELVEPPAIDGRALSDGFFASAGVMIAGLCEMMQGMLGRPIGAGDLEPFTRALVDDVRTKPGALDAARSAFATATAAYVRVFERHDVVLTPTLAVEPWRIGWLSPVLPSVELIARTERAVGYTPIHNIAGLPSMSVPLHWTRGGAPIGSCFSARRGAEDVLFALAYELEEAQPWRDRWAPFSYPVLVGA